MSQALGNATLDFFRRIWPEGHTYCIAVKPSGKGGMRQAFFTSIEQAAEFAHAASARGLEVYHGCAVYKDDSSRKATNAVGAQILWLDVDAGATKTYKTEREALAALLIFCKEAGLPVPMCVHSGGGWHAYWTLKEFAPAPLWLAFATALKMLCAQYNFDADSVRTADIASILRPVGTLNYKRKTPAEVLLKHAPDNVSLRDLAAVLQPRAAAPVAMPLVDNNKFAAKPVNNEEPSYGVTIANACRQLALLRDSEGRVPEPLWYAQLCLLAHCEDGIQLAHEWSKGDERYSYDDTARKLEQGRRASGPTTCDKLQSLNASGCVGCPHFGRITSPIQLGRTGGAPKITQVADVVCPVPPSPFKRSANGALLLTEPDEAGQPQTLTIYKAPLFLEDIREHEQTGEIVLIMKHWLPQEGWLNAQVTWSDRSQKTVINSLGAQKINIPRARERDLLWFLELSIDEFQLHRKTAMEYAQFGWREDFRQFVLGSELFEVGKDKPTFIGVSTELQNRAKQMKAYGSYEGWRSAVQPLFVHEQQGLMVVAGFASVLMRFVQELTGVIVAAVSAEPRLGKTMGLIAARSIWGDDNSIDIATNDTANSRFRMLAVLNGIPSTWDDMRKSNDPEIIKQFVLSFSQGRDKNRLEKSGALRSNTSGWASVLLATSNISIAELVGHDGETAQQARILEYRFEPMAGMKFSDGQGYERAMRQNRGQAGRKFIQALMLPGMVDWLKHAVPAYVKEFETALGRSDASFYASLLGTIKAASQILNKTGMLEFSVDRLTNFAIESAEMMGRLMEENRTDPSDVVDRFVRDNWKNTLVVADAFKPRTEATIRKLPGDKLFVRFEMNSQRLYIARDALRQWCRLKNIMFRDVIERLETIKIALSSEQKISLGAGTPFSGAGQTPCLVIDTSHPKLGNLKLVEELSAAPAVAVTPTKGHVHTVLQTPKRVLVPGKIQDAMKT